MGQSTGRYNMLPQFTDREWRKGACTRAACSSLAAEVPKASRAASAQPPLTPAPALSAGTGRSEGWTPETASSFFP